MTGASVRGGRPGLLAVACTMALAAGVHSGAVRAEEGGTGHYQPGSMSSFADGVAAAPTFVGRLNLVHYTGDFQRGQPLPIAGLTAIDASATATALGLTFAWVPDWGVLDETWTYQISTTIPLMTVDVTAGVAAGPRLIGRSSSTSGLGDIVLFPLMFNQKINPDLNLNYRLGIYAPTGNYEVGRLSNTGKNFWTLEPTFAVMYLGQKNGREVSVFFGADFNSENTDTHYQSGTQVHVDGTVAQHFPFSSGLAGVGLTAYWYRQVTGDSGSGASFGDFKGQTNGIGPVLSFAGKAGRHKTVVEFRWMREFGVEKRMSGDTLFLKAEMFID